MPSREFSLSTYEKDCVTYVSMETPGSHPEGEAFCGVWVNKTSDTSGDLGYWLEEPPMHSRPSAVSSKKLSYSSLRDEWTKVYYDKRLVGLKLQDAPIKVQKIIYIAQLFGCSECCSNVKILHFLRKLDLLFFIMTV